MKAWGLQTLVFGEDLTVTRRPTLKVKVFDFYEQVVNRKNEFE
jgi:hypothetical protein